MAETAAKTQGNEAYYSTSRSLGTGTTSTITMTIWRILDEYLDRYQRAVSASELSEATGLSVEQIDNIFAQEYYQKHYGFQRFDSLQAWHNWAMEAGLLFNPELHAVEPEDEDEEQPEEETDGAEETEDAPEE